MRAQPPPPAGMPRLFSGLGLNLGALEARLGRGSPLRPRVDTQQWGRGQGAALARGEGEGKPGPDETQRCPRLPLCWHGAGG